MQRKIFSISVIIIFTLGFAVAAFANVPAPVVNQERDIDDGIFNDLTEADCRFCHEGNDPNIENESRCDAGDGNGASGVICTEDADCPSGSTCELVTIKNRHHILALTPESIPDPESLIFNGQCDINTDRICSVDTDCPDHLSGEVCLNDPLPNPAVSPTAADVNRDGNRDGTYVCNSCHPDDLGTPINEFPITRDCLECHVQIGGSGSVHHVAATSPAQENRCFVCHGDDIALAPNYCSEGGGTGPDGTCAVDADCPGANNTCGDGHLIPTYEPSLVTPRPSDGQGEANPNSAIVFRGSCEYCHSTGNGTCSETGGTCTTDANCTGGTDICIPNAQDPGTDTATGVLVYGNSVTHHNTGVADFTAIPQTNCTWCHDPLAETQYLIRRCENCHGLATLHNIQEDSDAGGQVDTDADGVPDTDNLGNIFVGAENPWYGHVGNPDDCLGCHDGYVPASAPGTGPIVPNISSPDALSMSAGADKAVTLTGSAFENYIGTFLLTSNVTLTASDGSLTTLAPDAISASSLTVTVPGATAAGNYELRVAKDDGTGTGGTVNSAPVVLTVIPNVAIASVACNKKKGLVTVTGTGFGDKPAGTDGAINLQVNGQSVELISWADTKIKGSVDRCSKRAAVTVNAVFGSATNGKPCKGKKCR